MAKVAFTKLNKIKNLEPITCKIGDENIIIQSYLPVEEKLQLIQRIIEQAGDGEEGFFNIVKLEVFFTIEMLKAYTNISFTEKQLENITKLYDLIKINKIWEKIEEFLPQDEKEYIWNNTCTLAREITNYNHSILGILKLITADYNNSNLNLSELINEVKDPEALSLLKDIIPLMNNN